MRMQLQNNRIFFLSGCSLAVCQTDSILIDTAHAIRKMLVDGTDTLYIADLDDVQISASRLFEMMMTLTNNTSGIKEMCGRCRILC